MCDACIYESKIIVLSQGVYIGIGIDSDGRQCDSWFDVQDGESEDNWDTVLSFVQRGLFGVKLVISDAHKGLLRLFAKLFRVRAGKDAKPTFLRNIFDESFF